MRRTNDDVFPSQTVTSSVRVRTTPSATSAKSATASVAARGIASARVRTRDRSATAGVVEIACVTHDIVTQ